MFEKQINADAGNVNADPISSDDEAPAPEPVAPKPSASPAKAAISAESSRTSKGRKSARVPRFLPPKKGTFEKVQAKKARHDEERENRSVSVPSSAPKRTIDEAEQEDGVIFGGFEYGRPEKKQRVAGVVTNIHAPAQGPSANKRASTYGSRIPAGLSHQILLAV
jgi:hypothetical protein